MPPSSEMEAAKSDEGKEGECNNDLWRDLLDSLENVPLMRNNEAVSHMTVNMPRLFVEQYDQFIREVLVHR